MWAVFSRVLRSTDGTVLPYLALVLVVSLGLAGLSYDFGIQFVLLTELQKAADAAAVAGASQLDPTVDPDTVAARVNQAVSGAAITANQTRFANLPGDVVIASTRLLRSLPADDDAPIGASHVGPPYVYVEVTTAVATADFGFLRVFGAQSMPMTATAVAGREVSVCRITPIAVCNPAETALNPGVAFVPSDYFGRQIVGFTRDTGSQLSPAQIQWLHPPNIGNGASDLANALAEGGAAGGCFSGGVDLQPGVVASLRTAINTRFDLYEEPFFGGSASRDPRFAPAENVLKGYDTSDPPGCGQSLSSAPNIMALPRDTDLSADNRVGNGRWDCLAYWTVNHPFRPAPAGCSTPGNNTIMRFEIYLHEIRNGIIPDNGAAGGENGNPVCSTAAPYVSNTSDPAEFRNDRRVVTLVVLNCLEHGLYNSGTDVPVEGFITGFLTEPTVAIQANNSEIYIEVIGSSLVGQGGLAPIEPRDSVEVIR